MTTENIEELINKAKADAFAEGKKQGMELMQHATEDEKLKALNSIIHQLSYPLEEIDENIEQSLSQLALNVASHLYRQQLSIEPEKIQAIVHEAIKLMPINGDDIEVQLHPEDLAFFQDKLEIPGSSKVNITFTPNDAFKRGECKVQSKTSTIDGTLEGRLHAIFQQVFHHDE